MSATPHHGTCERCRADLPDEAAFCPMCGHRTAEAPPQPNALVDGRYEVPGLTPTTPAGEILRGRAMPAGGEVLVRVFPVENRDGGAAGREHARRLKKTLELLGGEAHPAVGVALDVVAEDGRVFVVDEPTEETTLHDWLCTHVPLNWRDLAGWAAQVLDTLAYVHSKNVFHGGPRPEHLRLADNGVVRLTGFGEPTLELAASEDRAGVFAPLELLGGRLPDAATDVYSFGVTLYELLVGGSPGHNHTGAIRLGDARPDLPGRVCDAVERALAPDLGRRFATAAAFRDALERPTELPDAPPADDADSPLENVDASPQPQLMTPPPGQGSPGAESASPRDSAGDLAPWTPERLTAEHRYEEADKPMHSWTSARPTSDAAALTASFVLIPAACLLISWLLPWWAGVFFLGAAGVAWRTFGDDFTNGLRERRVRLEASALVGSRVRIHGWDPVTEPPPFMGAFESDIEAARQPNWWLDVTISPPPGAGAPFPYHRLRRWRPRDLVLTPPRGEPGVAIRRVAIHDGRGFLLDDVGLRTTGAVRLRLLLGIPGYVGPPTLHYLGVPLAELRPPVGAAIEYRSAA